MKSNNKRFKNPLIDKKFLSLLDQKINKEIWAKIIALDINEKPVEEITGRITGGSINIDGTSAVRRSCSLSLTAKEMNINDFYWGQNVKFKVSIGITNDIDLINYPEIIWFPQGIFVITSFSTNKGINNYSVSIQGNDKMCLLNGSVGGSLTAPIDFGKIEETNENGDITIKDIPIKEIIKEAVHEYAKEPWHNIIINDLDEYGIELLEYKGSKPLYLFVKVSVDGNEITQMTLNETITDGQTTITLYDKKHYPLTRLNNDILTPPDDYETIIWSGEEYAIAKIEYGQTVGYRLTDITYAGDLIANAGDSLTSVLDKIVQMLGDFEYFYDLDGRFIFQRKKTYINQSWNNLTSNEKVYEEKALVDINSTPFSYEFTNNNLMISVSNNPDISSLKNDFSIWGTRKSITGAEIPIHLRYAIDKKPEFYRNINGDIYSSSDEVKIVEKKKEQWLKEFEEKVKSFEMKYADSMPASLKKPEKQADGTWSPGWWDIRDWYNYYYLIYEKDPGYTMKWYSRNDESGCVKKSEIGMSGSGHVWLIIKNGNSFNLQHGSGTFSTNSKRNCILYQSYYLDGNKTKYNTVQVKDENGKNITKDFYPPYSGCSDNHTYIEFLEGDVKKGRPVYFYNPNFPGYEDYEDMVEDKLEEELKDKFNEEEYNILLSKIKVVDWREIIYQMAKDYRKYNHLEKFLPAVKKNNYFNKKYYYPTGYTGYEQYYIDIEGFWRQLYNPNFKIDDKSLNLGGDGSIERKIEINETGTFNENLDNIYIYPIKLISKKADLELKDDNDNKIYTPENTYILFNYTIDGETHYCINPFINDFICTPKEKDGNTTIKYYRYYAANPDVATEISYDVAKATYPRSLLYIKKKIDNKDEYIRLVDDLFNDITGKIIISDLENLKNVTGDIVWKLAYIDNKNSVNIKDIVSNNNSNDVVKKYYATYNGNEIKYYNKFLKSLERNETKEKPMGYYSFKEIDYYHTIYNYYDETAVDELKYWNKAVTDEPESLNFWFDFMDTTGDINKYSVSAIGNRPKVVNDSSVKSIYFRETPKVIFINKNKSDSNWEIIERKSGYSYIQLPDSMISLFNISAQGKDAQTALDDCLYNDTYCAESISINTLPIYYLQPNTRIYVRNEDSKIDGEYIVSRFTIPLEYSGTMSISATKVAERIL